MKQAELKADFRYDKMYWDEIRHNEIRLITIRKDTVELCGTVQVTNRIASQRITSQQVLSVIWMQHPFYFHTHYSEAVRMYILTYVLRHFTWRGVE